MEGEIKNLTSVWIAVIISLSYTYFLSSKLPKGKWRLISLLPVFSLFTILPLYLTSLFLTAVVALFITWLANFKLLLFAFGRDPLSSSQSLPIFIAIASLPFKLKPKDHNPKLRKSKKLPLNLATEIPISMILIQIVYEYKKQFDIYFIMGVYCCLVFLLVDILVASSGFLARAIFGLDLESPSNEPYLSTSLRDFWSRRWNITVSGILRETVYKPVCSMIGREWAALPGVMMTFLVSGLMHELIFWYLTPDKAPSLEMTAFFVVQGVGVVVEFGIKMVLGRRRKGLVSGMLTIGFVVGTAFWLFFPPIMRNGVDVRVVEELRFAWEVAAGKVADVWLRVGGRWG